MTAGRNVYVLRPDTLSTEIVKCTAQLAAFARRKRLHGLAFVAMVEESTYIVNVAGAALDDPTLTRGMLRALDDKLALTVAGRVL